MAKQNKKHDELIDASLDALGAPPSADEKAKAERERAFEAMAEEVESPGFQDRIIERYQGLGTKLLSDSLPSHLDPTVARILEPMLGDVSDVRIHTGKVATEAAQAMDARAFAIGDRDIFVDHSLYSPSSKEGGQLLAHEIAHTRDAATGFALSSKKGHSREARELFAESVEMSFAREYELKGEAPEAESVQEEEASGGEAPSFREAKPDRDLLAEKVKEILQRQGILDAERHGKF